jgi:hypothetical protein
MFNKIKLYPFAFLVFFIALVIGVYTRLVLPQLAYTEFLGEQAREAFNHIKISQEGLLAYGPISSIGKYYIPGGYYTLMYVFSFWSNEPSVHILSNSIFSFLTILLFGLLVYRAFRGFDNVFKVLALAALLWSIFATDIFFAGFVWNPNSVAFFWMLLIVLFDLLLENKLKKFWKFGLWFAQGVILGILISLHSSALFIIPIVFLVNVLIAFRRFRNFDFLSFIPGFILILFPYISSEINNNFKNTYAIWDTVFNQTKEPHSVVEKLNHLFDPVIALANNVYFPLTNMPIVCFLLVLGVIIFGSLYYRGRRFYFFNFWLILVLFILASNSYWGPLHKHYMVLIWPIPLFFFISLFFVKHQSKVGKSISVFFLALGGLFFVQQNLEGISNIIANKFSDKRVVNVSDMKVILSQIPKGASVCTSAYYNSLKYLQFANEGFENTIFQENCNEKSQYEIVEKYKTNDFAPAIKNQYDTTNKKVFYTGPVYDIVKLK